MWYRKDEDVQSDIIHVQKGLVVAEFINLMAGKLNLTTPHSRLEIVFKKEILKRSAKVPSNSTEEQPLIIREIMYSLEEELSRFAAQLANFTAAPSGQTEKKFIRRLISGVKSYEHFIHSTERNVISVTRTDAQDATYQSYDHWASKILI